jgi:hypothetical protein
MKAIIPSILALIIGAATPNASAIDVEFLKLYLRIQEEVAKCPDASCYKGVYMKYGSTTTRNYYQQVEKKKLERIFRWQKEIAERDAKDSGLYVESEQRTGDRIELILKSSQDSGLAILCVFARENGEWKIEH